MGATKTAVQHPDDPFAGFPSQPVRCAWLTADDHRRSDDAEIIRLIVDENRGHCDAWANIEYQRGLLREVEDFVGATNAVLVTDAGCIKAYLEPREASSESLQADLRSLAGAVATLGAARHEWLLGVDGCIRGEATHLQTMFHLNAGNVAADTTVKIYPTSEEENALVGWKICLQSGAVPEFLAESRIVSTKAGRVMIFVCNDACIFAARSRANTRDRLKLAIRDHLLDLATTQPRPEYLVIAAHWLGVNADTGRWSGEPFRQAAKYLSDATGATVVTTLRAAREDLANAADRFGIIGPRSDKVATLLVSDTL